MHLIVTRQMLSCASLPFLQSDLRGIVTSSDRVTAKLVYDPWGFAAIDKGEELRTIKYV